jgi:hypothetical protein
MNRRIKQVATGLLAVALAVVFFCYLTPREEIKISGIMVTFDDGSTQIVGNGEEMSMYDWPTGRKAVSISTIVSVNPVYSDVLKSYSFSGRTSFQWVRSYTENPINLGTQTLSASGSVLPSGVSTVIISGAASASAMESLIRGYGGAQNAIQYKLRLHAETPLTLTLTFSGGQTQSLSYTPSDYDWWFRLGA